jgi:hypothetical protein
LVNEDRNIEDNPPLLPCGNNADGKNKRIAVLEFETNGVSTTPTPGVLGYSALHLLLATRIEPVTEEEIEAMKRGDWERMITRVDVNLKRKYLTFKSNFEFLRLSKVSFNM